MRTVVDMKHIFLIGMMGCGKSAVGQVLAQKLRLPFTDLDSKIENEQGRTISDIFQAEGEAYFRTLETEALEEMAEEKTDHVISCGGGIVLANRNIEIMRKTGTVIWIVRNVETIVNTVDTTKRPLLKEGAGRVRQIFEERRSCYEKAGDIRIENDGTIEQTAQKIMCALNL